ncbi:MAG: ABC1 kinase family protein [Mycobacteriales bacterium]
MAVSLRPQHLHRYQQIASLLMRHGRSDLVRSAGLGSVLEELSGDEAVSDAESLAVELEAMGPTFVKLGQLLASRVDILPAAYTDALSRLQDDVAAFSFQQVEQLIAEELGVRVSRIFRDLDPEPVAAASLAQVHRGVLRSGAAVAVKVQRPDIRPRVADDLEVLAELAEFVDRHSERVRRFALTDLLDQFRRSLIEELDYRREASNLSVIAELLRDQPRIQLPRPHLDFTTSRVLTMDFLAGRKVTKIGQLARMELDLAGLADELFRAYLRQVLVAGTFHADPHPGNVLVTPDGDLALVDLGQVARLPPSVQERLVKMFVALGDGRSEEVARALVDLGQPLEDFDERRFLRAVANTVEEVGLRMPAGTAVLQLARDSATCGLRPAPELAMLGKVLLSLDQVAACLDPGFSPDSAVRRHTAEIVRHGVSVSPARLIGAMLETREFVEELPGRVNRAMDAVASGRFQLRVQAFDEAEFLSGLHKLANVGAAGLVIASLVIGAALLAGSGADGTRSAVALGVFIAAVLMGIGLLVQIVVTTRQARRRR